MKYDIAMHLLANGMIEKEQYELVSKILSGVRITQDDLEEELEYKKSSTYSFSGKLPNIDDTYELEISKDSADFFFNYRVSGLYFEVTQNPKNQMGLYVIRESSTDPSSRKNKDYYLINKKEKDDFITVRYYDKDAYNFVRDLDYNLEFLELDDYEKAGIIPDEEVIINDVDMLDFAHSLIAPFTTGIGSFDETVDRIIHPAKQKSLEY
ncbi:MAG: hypothetical protein IKE63_06370 [Bacilli bacterium]|nr:hypothetical protein [Bacilli bacterium]